MYTCVYTPADISKDLTQGNRIYHDIPSGSSYKKYIIYYVVHMPGHSYMYVYTHYYYRIAGNIGGN